MIEKILKETYVNPKVELTQNDYNRLVSMAKMNARKIEERAREIYDKDGVAKIQFTGRFYRKRYGEVETEKDEFIVDCEQYHIVPSGDYEKTLYMIPAESRRKIAKHVKVFIEDAFESMYGEHMMELNEIKRLRHKAQRQVNKFIICTVTGWLTALIMMVVIILRTLYAN